MKKILYILGMAVVTMFTSCQKDADLVSAALIDRAVTFSAESITPLTRVSGTSWDDGDVIGITMLSSSDQSVVYDNIEYTVSDDDNDDATVSFTPTSEAICYPQDDSAVDFKAYYPYQEEWSYKDNTTVWDLSDQDGTLDAQSAVDLLGSAAYNKADGNAVSFQFTHSLSKVQITVSNYDEFSAFENLEELSATLYTKNTLYNLSTEEIVSSEETKEIKMVKSSNDDESVVFTAIIAPCDMSDEIIFTDGTSYYTAPLAIEANAGKLYTFTATVGDQGITLVELTGDNVIDWDSQSDTTLNKDLEIVDNVYYIYTAAGLKMFADWVNDGETSINGKLMNNIDLNGSVDNEWTPIGSGDSPYKGTFDGGNFEVSGLYINQSSSNNQALFGYTSSATIYNLGVDGSVVGYKYIGGIAGTASETDIINCYNKAKVNGGFYIGGIVGRAMGTSTSIINCYNTGDLTGTEPSSESIGGIAGSANSTTITSCYSSAALVGETYIGGVVGYTSGTTITSCYYDSDNYSGNGIGDGSGDVTGYSTAYMQSNKFIILLNNAAYTYNEAVPPTNAHAWKAVEEGYPIFDTENEPTHNNIRDIAYNTESGVYQIYSGNGMRTFADLVNGSQQSISELDIDNSAEEIKAYFIFGTAQTSINGLLMNDIDLEGSANNLWTPIGTGEYDDTAYCGVFDGDGYSVTRLYVVASTKYQGLFGSVVSGTVQNLSVGGSVEETSAGICGVIVGFSKYATYISCTVLEGSSVSGGSDSVAGISGYNYGVTFTDCHNHASVSGTYYVGGIAGWCNASDLITFTNCSNTGAISSSGDTIGGIVGRIHGKSGVVHTITNCFNSGKISGGQQHVGGLVGSSRGGVIYNSYNIGEVYGVSANVGGLVGIFEDYSDDYNYGSVMENCYTSAKVTGGSNVGLAVGNCDVSTITNCYYDNSQSGEAIGTDNNDQSVTGYSTDEMQSSTFVDKLNTGAAKLNYENIAACSWAEVSNSYPTFDYDNLPTLDAVTATTFGSGTENNPYVIYYTEQMEDLATQVNSKVTYSGIYFRLANNIDLGGSASNPWTPIGGNGSTSYTFYGSFDGGGYTISGLYIYATTTYQGLFGRVREGTVKNLTVEGEVTVTMTSDTYVGGIVGYSYGSTISNCHNKATVHGYCYVGGVVGNAASGTVVTNCFNEASISCDYGYVGGIVGYAYNSSTFVNCGNIGSVTNEEYHSTGGVAGYSNGSSFTNCYNNAAVTSLYLKATSNNSYGGGFVGNISSSSSSSSFTNCYYNSDYNQLGQGISSSSTYTSMTTKEMEAELFVTTLNNNVSSYNAQNPVSLACEWVAVSGSSPMLDFDK